MLLDKLLYLHAAVSDRFWLQEQGCIQRSERLPG